MNYPVAIATKWIAEEKYRGRYRIPSARLPYYRYTASAWYFITICTGRRVRCLSSVSEGQIELTDAGQVVQEEWLRTPGVRPYVVLDAWVIMPDHFHGLIGITNPPVETPRWDVSGKNQTKRTGADTHHRDVSGTTNEFNQTGEMPHRDVSGKNQTKRTGTDTHRRDVSGTTNDFNQTGETPHRDVSTGVNQPRLVAHSLGAIIGQFKSICTKRIRAHVMPDFAWQSRFYDRIVRNEREFERIRNYIIENPKNWHHPPP